MRIELVAPPIYRPRLRYAEAMKMVMASPSQWIRLSLDEITGQTNATKHVSIWQAADARKIKIETTVSGGFFYVRQVVGV